MNQLAQTIYLIATDPVFRRALQADPKAAIVAWRLHLNDEEWDVLMEMWDLLTHYSVVTQSGRCFNETIPFWFGGPPLATALEK